MPNLYTPVTLPESRFPFSYADRIVLLGSCFAENIGERLKANKFCTDVNPFGIVYNPASVALAIRRLIRPERFTDRDLFEHGGMFHSFAHHSLFSSASREAMLENINRRLDDSAAGLRRATRLAVTFGTAYVYRLNDGGQVVANCHKLPEKMFSREMLTVGEIVSGWRELLRSLWEHAPQVKLLLTVSPIRHRRDGAHGNQLSKATLLLAAEELRNAFPAQVDYFPAYELMMDELRDYRFYAGDMLHPSPLAIEYIWERFSESCLTKATLDILTAWEGILKAVNHKPFHPGSEEDVRFVRQTLLKMEQLQKKMPSFDMENERKLLESRLNGQSPWSTG